MLKVVIVVTAVMRRKSRNWLFPGINVAYSVENADRALFVMQNDDWYNIII